MRLKEYIFILALTTPVFAYSAVPDKKDLRPTPTLTLEEERKSLELERMKLENEKLKLELERAKLQAPASQPVNVPKEPPRGNRKEDLQVYQAEVAGKAEELAKTNKEQTDLIVLDFANAEVWHHGVRYGLHELYSLAGDANWTIKKTIAARASNGYPRYLYKMHNTSLLRYEGHERGIVEILPPAKGGDIRIVTTEGTTFDSSVGDVRNAYQSVYFSYDGLSKKESWDVLRYKHSRGLNFSDKLEFFIGKDGKIIKIRYGVLDEH